ncbi:conserved hypothetical protein [Pseudomonas protegens Pf-5]|uniref:Uncharacterized protein n=1 Tax=Pseudomonas fluorescens (strain ATCC BAA-477 / NRRL B-23932 / Pf-5) TaxID=220664 RepID=Q4KKM1_PSEF5|nr:conserved hypothetical protein [Pseudomonas protegens Pf-5]
MVHRFVQLVGEGFADQLVGDEVGDSHVQGDQRTAEMLDVQVVDLFHQTVGQIGFIQQAVEADVAIHDGRRLEEELLGDLQHRLDLRLDAGFPGYRVGGVQKVWNLVDIGADKTGHDALGVDFGQLDGGVQVRQLALQLTGQEAGTGFVLLGQFDLLAQCGGVHENSREQGQLNRENIS